LTGARVEASSDRELDLHVAIWEEPRVGDRYEAQVAPDVDFPTEAPYLSRVGCRVQLRWAYNDLIWGRMRVSYMMRHFLTSLQTAVGPGVTLWDGWAEGELVDHVQYPV
jgi:hypothetical protein